MPCPTLAEFTDYFTNLVKQELIKNLTQTIPVGATSHWWTGTWSNNKWSGTSKNGTITSISITCDGETVTPGEPQVDVEEEGTWEDLHPETSE